jgi:predicted Ser/Thr protein kinase
VNGQRIGIYDIVGTLARGGTAVVYLARQAALDREVALKRLDLDSSPLLAQRFVREARLAAALDHPNVVTVFDFFEHDAVPYIAMEYVAGGSLRPFVGRLALPQVIRVLEGVLAGLGHAEERGVAHRDLKPENVLLTRRGGVKIADFGIARAYNAVTAQLTSTGSAIGTPAYMAPEQAQNERLGPYTDMYAVGVIAYELLAGRPPFKGSTPVAVLYQHVHAPPPPLDEVAPNTPPRVREWVGWLLAKEPLARPASATEAWEALEEIAVEGVGPYWRRAGAITAPMAPEPPASDAPVADEQPTTADSPPERPTLVDTTDRPAPLDAPDGIPRRRIAAAVAVAVTAGVLGLLLLRSDDAPHSSPSRAATPFDFDGDGREELVLGMPESAARDAPVASGVVVVHEGPGSSDSAVISPNDAGVRGASAGRDQFGGGLASADFNRDGLADLAVGAPGRELVSVVYGTENGLAGGATDQIPASAMGLPETAGRYGVGLAAADFDGNGFGDLVIGAPGPVPVAAGQGVMQIIFGAAGGLQIGRPRAIPPPDDALGDFGNRLRAADVNGDGLLDIVAGAPDRLYEPSAGHLVFCPGKRGGPDACVRVGVTADGGTSSLGIADVDGDDYEDIVQGDGGGERGDGGEVRLWRGGPRGPAARPISIDQDTADVAGRDEPNDGFGTVVDVGDTDPDGHADMLIGAPGENGGAGAVTLVRGAERGWAAVGSEAWHKDLPDVPGTGAPDEHFGSAVGVLQLTDDHQLDLVVIAGGARRLGAAVTVIQGTRGAFAPSEALASRIERLAEQVEPSGINALRIGRPGRQPSSPQ